MNDQAARRRAQRLRRSAGGTILAARILTPTRHFRRGSPRPPRHLRRSSPTPPEPADGHPGRLDGALEALLPIVRAAGALVMDIDRSDFAVRGKDDASPVTEADERAEALIVPALEALLPRAGGGRGRRGGPPARTRAPLLAGRSLDGTKEFIGRNGEFTVTSPSSRMASRLLRSSFAPALERLFLGAGRRRIALTTQILT